MLRNLPTVERAARGDLKGLPFVGLARLSFEPNYDTERPVIPLRGTDYSNREDQERRCREYVESRGGIYLGTIHEPDTSAWKKKRVTLPDGTYGYRVIRPKFERILKNLKSGVLGDSASDISVLLPPDTPVVGLVFPKDDRLTRNHRHLQDAIEVVENFDRPIIDVKGTLDLLTESGRSMSHLQVEMSKKQSDATSERVAEKHYNNAIRGIPAGGKQRFGMNKDRRTRNEREAQILRDGFQDLREGVGLRTLVKKWYDAGIRSPLGNPISRQVAKGFYLNPAIAGIRAYLQPGKPLQEHYLKDVDGNYVMGQWEAILTIPEWEEVKEILVPQKPSETNKNSGRYKYLCSGYISCGECAGKLEGHSGGRNGYYQYSCNHLGCGKVSGSGKTIDRLITEAVHDYFADYQVSTKEEPWPKAGELEELNITRKKLAGQYSANIDLADVILPKIRETDEKITKLTRERRAFTRTASIPKASSIIERWDTLELEQKRAIVGEVFEVIILYRAAKGSNRFNPERLKIVRKRSLSIKKLKLLGLHILPVAA